MAKAAVKQAPTKITVRVPDIQLKMEDLAYLKQLSAGVYCSCSHSVKNRCIFLGLVEDRDVIPAPEKMAEWVKEKFRQLEEANTLLASGKYAEFENVACELDRGRPTKHNERVVTEAGLALLKTGVAHSKITEKGACL